MSEEIRNPGAGISESALEGVGGGDQKSLDEAKRVCAKCREHNVKACNGGSPELVAALPSKITLFTHCPYYGKPVG